LTSWSPALAYIIRPKFCARPRCSVTTTSTLTRQSARQPTQSHTMFRSALLRTARSAARAAPRCQAAMARSAVRPSFVQARQTTPSTYFQAVRRYAASAGLSQEEVTGRIMDLLKNFDKVWEEACAMRLDFLANSTVQVQDTSKVWRMASVHCRMLTETTAERRITLPQRPGSRQP
jgi:hypothetical protein